MEPAPSKHVPVFANGINVQFPFQPYDTQVDYIKSVLEAISNNQNALLESPTGTGKTLSLICASLGWLSNTTEKSTIYYTSRTHAQLGQVAREQKKTAYAKIPSVVLGSRAQTCLNVDVRREGADHLINRACRNAITKNACPYYSNYEQKLETLDTNQVLDIETLGDWGRKQQCCPYYAGKKLAESKASLVMMPYNYLLDPSLSKGFPLRLEKSVIIIDEAHNVDSVLKDAVSGKFTKTCLKNVMDSCRALPEKLNEALNRELHGLSRHGYNPQEKRGGSTDEFGGGSKKSSKNKDKDSNKEAKPNLIEELSVHLTNERLQQVIECARKLESETRNIIDMEKVNNMDRIFKLLETAGVEYKTSDLFLKTLDSMISFWSVAGVMSPTLVAKYVTATQNFHNFISIIFPEICLSVTKQQVHRKKLDDYYIAYLEGSYERGKVVKNYKGGELKDWTLNIWCLHPAIGLKRAIDSNCINGPKSIILTSGTLAPMGSIEKELDTDFKVIRQFKHVIEENQFKVMIVGESPDGFRLTSNFESTEKDEYKKAIGKTLLALFRILPHGTLVFFSSYSLMTKVIRFWKEKSSIWSDMSSTTNIFVESKTHDNFGPDMYNYKRKLESKNSRAVFFGVCRGKLSEGINLEGNQCRTVIMTGLPFPNSTDPKVLSTRNFQAKRVANGGNMWYLQQMTRALNQTVGRVIRSKDDYGMLLLCDPRFKEYKYSLSEWTRPFIPMNHTRICDVDKSIKAFFIEHGDQISSSFSESVGAFEVGFNTTASKPINSYNSVTNKNTVTTKNPIITHNPIVTNNPIIINDPIIIDDPITVNNRITVDNPIIARPPVTIENPVVNKCPVAPDKPTVINNPFKTKKPQNIAQNTKKKLKTATATTNNNLLAADGSFQHYSILDQFKDKNRPSSYQCFMCFNEAKNPHRTNCPCARVACLSEIRVLDKKICGKCGVELRLKNFKQCLFKSAFYSTERQPVLVCKGKKPS